MVRAALAAALLAAAWLTLGAAAPFAPLATDAPTQARLQHYLAAGLLTSLPDASAGLSRAEAALLVKKSLVAYTEAKLSGLPADPQLEADLQADLAEFSPELAVMGVDQASLPASTAATAADAAFTASPCEPAAAPTCKQVGPDEADACSCGMEEEDAKPEVTLTPYADVALQLRAGRTAVAAGGNLDTSDLTVYWGEVGVDAVHRGLSGHVSALLDNKAAGFDLHEAYVAWQDKDDSDWSLRAGRMVLPPGSRATTFPTYPAAVDLAYTTTDAIGVTLGSGKSTLSAYAFNPSVEMTGENDTLSDYAVGAHLASGDDADRDGFAFNATFTSNLGASDLAVGGAGPLRKRVAGANTWAEGRWGGEHRVLAEYSWSFSRFDPTDLDVNNDGAGDKPAAFDAEYVHTSPGGEEFGVAYERTRELADYAQQRWSLLGGWPVDDMATLRVELSRGQFGSFTTNAAQNDTRFVTELRVKY